jgi:short-subunit dehydrogenase
MAAAIIAHKYPGYALITGASSGIGRAFAQALALQGVPLVLVARRQPLLDDLAADLRAQAGVDVRVLALDLTLPDAPQQVKAFTDQHGLPVSVLVNNAGYGSTGDFITLDAAAEARMVDLNCRVPVALTALYAPLMAARRSGAIIFVGSTASYQPLPTYATYAATKAFDLHFGEALWVELRPHGVDVITVCPGATETEFQSTANITNPRFTQNRDNPQTVVAQTLRHLGRKPSFTVGAMNSLMASLYRFLPRRLVVEVAQRVTAS